MKFQTINNFGRNKSRQQHSFISTAIYFKLGKTNFEEKWVKHIYMEQCHIRLSLGQKYEHVMYQMFVNPLLALW